MYGGDCQVLSNMGGNVVVPTDSLFSSPIHNPNFNFMAGSMNFHSFPPVISSKEENGLMMKGKEEMMDSGGSGSDHFEGLSLSGNEQDNNVDIDQQQQLPKKKRYHRHTARQIQEMEAVFKECPHPDDKQRTRLSQELGLKPRQVKFWFQNRRTQMKAQQDRSDNAVLRTENENLRNENYRLQAALRNIVCPNCGGAAIIGEISFDEQQLRIDNARLKEELERVCSIASRYSGRPIQAMIGPPPLLPRSLELEMGMYPRHDFQDPMGNCSDHMTMPMPPMLSDNNLHFPEGIMIMDEEKQLALELAVSSMDELMKMCRISEPLWIETKENGKVVLNLEEYARMFPWSITNSKQNPNEYKTEATRESAVVIMNSITLVDAFLDATKWMELFPSIVSRARTVQVITSGISGHANGSLQLMSAALQFLSPLVPTREAYFLRYCHQNVEEGIWAIVDFPIDNLHNSNANAPFSLYKRRPSGCIIQDMPNGYSRVTWVEHAELDDKPIHQIFNPIISSGMAFGAKRWLALLQRQCERVASLMARNIPDLGVIPSLEARKNLMNLSQRMIRTFCSSIGNNPGGQSWTALSESYDDTVRITTRRISGPGQPNGVILAAVSTTMLPHPHFRVFDLLRDERRRCQLGVLANGSSLNEVAHIANGSHHGNCISLLRINVASNSSQNVELMLQESCIDESGCLVVFTTIDVDSIQLAMNGEDLSCISLLPMGFVINPIDQPNIAREVESEPNNNNSNSNSASSSITTSGGSCLLTVGVQMLASAMPTAKLSLTSVTAINNHINDMVNQISMALGTTTTTIIHENGTEDLDLQQQQQPCAADKPSAE